LVTVHLLKARRPTPTQRLLINQLEAQIRRVKEGVLALLESLSDKAVIRNLIDHLEADRPEVWEQALELLMHIADRDLMQLLTPLLESDPEARLADARTAGNWHRTHFEEAVAYLAQSSDPWTSLAARWVKDEHIQTQDSVPE